jgi:hypothetical protein
MLGLLISYIDDLPGIVKVKPRENIRLMGDVRHAVPICDTSMKHSEQSFEYLPRLDSQRFRSDGLPGVRNIRPFEARHFVSIKSASPPQEAQRGEWSSIDLT